MCFSLFIVVYRSLNKAIESPTPYAGHAIGNGDGGEASAVLESPKVNARYAVGRTFMRD